MIDDDIRDSLGEEIHQAGTARGHWHAEYPGLAYRFAVAKGLARVERTPAAVLKTDLWNECLGGTRDVLGHLQETGGSSAAGVSFSWSRRPGA